VADRRGEGDERGGARTVVEAVAHDGSASGTGAGLSEIMSLMIIPLITREPKTLGVVAHCARAL
jgi:hypothetical protein